MDTRTLTHEELNAALPDTSGTVILNGLGAPVEICRDSYGIPHVKAQSISDAFFAQGFVTAQDRLWHMEYDRRRAGGRWAELAGTPGLEQDRLMRRFRLEASARADYDVLEDATRTMLDAYALGVNAFIETSKTLPIEYRIVGAEPEPWEPWHSLAVFKVRHILMGVFEAKLWRARMVNHLGAERTAQLFPGYPKGHLLILPPGAEFSGPIENGLNELARVEQDIRWLSETAQGSNSWALAGSRTSSGKPLVAGDPHRGLEVPNVYYQNHLTCPEFDVVGLSFPGVPGFPHFGHNDSVAWCVTHTNADYQDLFVERFKTTDATVYEFKGAWLDAEVHHETIGVRGGSSVELDVTVTQHGPIVVGDPSEGYGIAFKYTGTSAPIKSADALLNMLRTKSTDELDESMRSWVDPVNNFVFADVHGNIGYLTRGQVPVRSRTNAWVPVPGWSGEQEWQGIIPFEEMPRERNPETGHIVTANNRVTGEEYPHFIAFQYAPEFRARRITDRLAELGGKANVEDMASIHAEMVSIPAKSLVPLLSKIQASDDYSKRALHKLQQWNGFMGRDKIEPTIYSAFYDNLLSKVLGHVLDGLAKEALEQAGPSRMVNTLRARLHIMIQEDDRSLLPPGADWSSLMTESFSSAIVSLRRSLEDDMEDWRWGRIHHTLPKNTLSPSFPHLAGVLDPPPVPMGGDGETPQAAAYSLSSPYVVSSTSVARYVFDLGDWDNSAWVVPLGASGHPGSPHYADQLSIWSEVRLVPMLYDWGKIKSESESHQSLEPK